MATSITSYLAPSVWNRWLSRHTVLNALNEPEHVCARASLLPFLISPCLHVRVGISKWPQQNVCTNSLGACIQMQMCLCGCRMQDILHSLKCLLEVE